MSMSEGDTEGATQEGEGLPGLICPIEKDGEPCGAEFQTRGEMEKHLLEAHGLKKYVCEWCGGIFDTPTELGRHKSTRHPEKRRPWGIKKAQKAIREILGKAPEEEEDITALTEDLLIARLIREGPVVLHQLLRKRLEQLLDQPGIAPQSKTFALEEWDRQPAIRDDLNLLLDSLIHDAGIKEAKAIRIVQKLDELAKRYAPYLIERGIPFRFYTGTPQLGFTAIRPPTGGYPGYGYQGYQGPYYGYPPPGTYPGQPPPPYPGQPPYTPYYQPPPPTYPTPSPYEVRTLVKEEMERVKEALAAQVQELRENLPRILSEGRQEEPRVSIPIMVEGLENPINIEVPQSQAILYLTQMKGSKVPPELKVQLERLEDELKTAREEAEKLKEKLEEKEKERLQETIESLREELKETREEALAAVERAKEEARTAAVAGYRSDAYRLLGQGLERLGGALEKAVERWQGPGTGIAKALSPIQPLSQAPPERGASSEVRRELERRLAEAEAEAAQ